MSQRWTVMYVYTNVTEMDSNIYDSMNIKTYKSSKNVKTIFE